MNKEDVIQFFKSCDLEALKKFYLKYIDYFKNGFTEDFSDRVDPDLRFPEKPGDIACFFWRAPTTQSDDPDIDFNFGKFDDLEFVIEKTEDNFTLHIFRVTCDPCRNKQGIAHAARQIYCGNIGHHHGDERRICIRSDKYGTWLKRSDEDGNMILLDNGHAYASKQKAGINNHDQGAFFDSSLACEILFGGGWMVKDGPYASEFKPLLENCLNTEDSNKNHIIMAIIDHDDMADIIAYEIPIEPEKPPVVSTHPNLGIIDMSGEAKGAIRDGEAS